MFHWIQKTMKVSYHIYVGTSRETKYKLQTCRNLQTLPPSLQWYLDRDFSWMLARENSMVRQYFSYRHCLGQPNIDDVTCLLTPSVDLWGSQYQYQETGLLQGERRFWKIPHCHHHNQFTHHRMLSSLFTMPKTEYSCPLLSNGNFCIEITWILAEVHHLLCCASIHSTSRCFIPLSDARRM